MGLIGITSDPLGSFRRPSQITTTVNLARNNWQSSILRGIRENGISATSARSPVYPKIFVSAPQQESQFFVGISNTMRGGIKY